jgi:RNA polymerase nonessential primary-like sigma factor
MNNSEIFIKYDLAEVEEVASINPEASKAKSRGKEYNTNTVVTYCREVNSKKLLSAEQELELAERIVQGDQLAFRTMIESNLRLVVRMARRYVNYGMDLSDLIEEGNFGLMKAAKKYKASLGCRFSTYAIWWIRQSIETALLGKLSLVKRPSRLIRELRKCKKQRSDFMNKLHDDSDGSHMAIRKMLDFVSRRIGELAVVSGETVSLDASIDNEDKWGATFGDVLEDENLVEPEDVMGEDVFTHLMEKLLCELDETHREVLFRRFGLGGYEQASLEEVAHEMQIHKSKVKHLQDSAIRKLHAIIVKGEDYDALHDI